VDAQRQKLGRVPRMAAADAGFYSRENEQVVQQMGVAYVSIPNRSTRSEERRNYKRGAGSRMLKNGVPDVKDESAR